MKSDDQALWERVRGFEISNPNAEFSFVDRLARENSWTLEFAIRVIFEYKKFMFLNCIAKHPLTPSDEVDQVWHLHLIYTESYWADFCNITLGKTIQHGPTRGGESEKTRYTNGYESTKELYRSTFENEPPEDIWPSSAIRFGQIRFSRVNLHTNWVVPKPGFLKKWKF